MIKHTTIYGASTVIRNITGLIMLPIYTRFLTPADYAVLELLSMSIDFTGIVVGNRIGHAIFRFYMLADSDSEKKSVISSSFFLAVFLNTLGFILIYLFSSIIADLAFGSSSYRMLLVVFGFTLITEALIFIPLNYIRALEKPFIFLYANIFKLVMQVALNVYFVVILGMAVEGVVYGALISTSVLGAILSAYLLRHTGMNLSLKICKKVFLFSLPIGIGTIASFFITFGDRFFIRAYHDLTEVGLYTLAYKFAFIFATLSWAPFSQMWDARKYKILKEVDPGARYRDVFNYLTLFLITFGLVISLFIKDLLMILSDQSFWPAARIVPILLVAYVFHAWFQFANFGILYSKKTKYIALSEWIAGVAIALLYFLFIPSFGAYGAAFATLIVFYLRFLFVHICSKKLYDMTLRFSLSVKLFLLSSAIYCAAYLLAPEDIIFSIAVRMLLFGVYAACLFFLPIMDSHQKDEIIVYSRGLLQSLSRQYLKMRG